MEDYANDLLELWREQELAWSYPRPLGPCNRWLNARQRAILVDWLIEVHHRFRLHEGTLYLAVYLTDAYLAKRAATLDTLQLIGITALLIASKYEDVEAPELTDCTRVSGTTETQILACEMDMLKVVDWKLTITTPYHWLARLAPEAATTVQRTMLEIDYFDFEPSRLAAAAYSLMPDFDTSKCFDVTGFRLGDLIFCADVLKYHQNTPIDLHALSSKFKKRHLVTPPPTDVKRRKL